MITVVLIITAVEFVLRVTLPVLRTASMPGKMIQQHLQGGALAHDPDLFWYWPELPIPALELNQHGFRRTAPMTVHRPRGVIRVVTLGDSQTWGAFHPEQQSYPAVAERTLGPGWEVLNAAVPGYRSLNVYRLLQRRVESFRPDVIVVDCMPFDSVRDDSLLHRAPLGAGLLKRVLWHSRMYYAVRHLVAEARRRSIPSPRVPRDEVPVMDEGDGNHDLIKAWAEARGVRVVFMEYTIMSRGELKCVARPDLLPPGSVVVRMCQVLKGSGYKPGELFHDLNHLTVQGNKLVGGALASTLRSLDIPRATDRPTTVDGTGFGSGISPRHPRRRYRSSRPLHPRPRGTPRDSPAPPRPPAAPGRRASCGRSG